MTKERLAKLRCDMIDIASAAIASNGKRLEREIEMIIDDLLTALEGEENDK